MHSYTTKDGRVLEWGAKGVCICTKCDEIFNSVAAFDHHLKKKKKGDKAVHDISGMPRNSKGYLVISLRDYEGLDK